MNRASIRTLGASVVPFSFLGVSQALDMALSSGDFLLALTVSVHLQSGSETHCLAVHSAYTHCRCCVPHGATDAKHGQAVCLQPLGCHDFKQVTCGRSDRAILLWVLM